MAENTRPDRSRSPPLDAHTRGDNKAWSNFGLKMFITTPTYVSPTTWNMGSLSFEKRSIVGRAGPAAGAGAAAAGPKADAGPEGQNDDQASEAAGPNGPEADAGAGPHVPAEPGAAPSGPEADPGAEPGAGPNWPEAHGPEGQNVR